MLSSGHTTIEHASLDGGHVLGEALILVANLEGELACVAEHYGVNLVLHGFELLQCGEHKDSSLSHSRLRLADNIHAQDGLRNALVLHCSQKTESTESAECADVTPTSTQRVPERTQHRQTTKKLTFRRMLETAVDNGLQELRLQKEVTETRTVHAYVGAPAQRPSR